MIADKDILLLQDEFDTDEMPQLRQPEREARDAFISIGLDGRSLRPGKVTVLPTVLELSGFEEAPASLPAFASSQRRSALSDLLDEAIKAAVNLVRAEERSRAALYETLGIAYDFTLAAVDEPEEYVRLIKKAGLKVQERAPLIPLLRLIFGKDYDRSRLTEYSTALTNGLRHSIGRGDFAQFLLDQSGGLKAIVAQERAIRRGELQTKPQAIRLISPKLARSMRELSPIENLTDVGEQEEFFLLVGRRCEGSDRLIIGQVPFNKSLIERAARLILKSTHAAKDKV